VPATRHEWLHARIHARARGGDALASALQTVVSGPAYRPDAFHVDEVTASVCDLLRARERGVRPERWQVEMAMNYARMLRSELQTMVRAGAGQPEGRAGVAGVRLRGSDPTTVRWIGGRDVAHSLAVLRSVSDGAEAAVHRLTANPPDLAGARAAVPLVADLCVR
jgi:hypothetical protein